MKLDDYVRLNQLYDLYGKLLTERQYEVMRLHVCDDLSLFEISEAMGITRQAVSDALNTARTKLEDYERRLGFFEKTEKTTAALQKFKEVCGSDSCDALADELYNIWKLNYEED